jgi:hypothetical protein
MSITAVFLFRYHSKATFCFHRYLFKVTEDCALSIFRVTEQISIEFNDVQRQQREKPRFQSNAARSEHTLTSGHGLCQAINAGFTWRHQNPRYIPRLSYAFAGTDDVISANTVTCDDSSRLYVVPLLRALHN